MKKSLGTTATPEKVKTYKEQRNLCNRLVKKERRQWYNKRIREKGRTEIWNIANELTKPPRDEETIKVKIEGTLTEDEEKVANGINEFFIQKVKKLSEGIDRSKAILPTQKLQEARGDRDNKNQLVLKTIQEGKTRKISRQFIRKTC